MRQILLVFFITASLTMLSACALRPSPPKSASETTDSGVNIRIDYSSPGIKGRTIGNEIAPWGEVWRTGANKATVFEVSQDVEVEGEELPAGKYSLYSIPGEEEWVIILNKEWDQSGSLYDQDKDALRVTVKTLTAPDFSERMIFRIDKTGVVSLTWGDYLVNFTVK